MPEDLTLALSMNNFVTALNIGPTAFFLQKPCWVVRVPPISQEDVTYVLVEQ